MPDWQKHNSIEVNAVFLPRTSYHGIFSDLPVTMTLDDENIQVSACGKTVWVHSDDGSTVGRFSKTFGMDVHTTVPEQLAGASQCLHCTHQAPTQEEWLKFCELMQQHYGITVPTDLIRI